MKVDEDLPEEVALIFSTAECDSAVRSQGWGGLLDEELWTRVEAEGRWLVTADKEFADVRKVTKDTKNLGLIA